MTYHQQQSQPIVIDVASEQNTLVATNSPTVDTAVIAEGTLVVLTGLSAPGNYDHGHG
ncbi:MAG: hypothetical protein ACLP4V_10495 [Methylocella sp.]